jgi:hypothetical protein
MFGLLQAVCFDRGGGYTRRAGQKDNLVAFFALLWPAWLKLRVAKRRMGMRVCPPSPVLA